MGRQDPTDLSHWLSWAAEQHPQAMKFHLGPITRVGQLLNVIQAPCPVITVAGTNGKGSTVAAITAMAVAAGKRVGSFTSPHLLQFNERIAVNGAPCSDEALCEAFSAVEKAMDACQQALTFFEITTLVALYLFQRQCLDLWVLEVGLGGRLDAVNCVEPDVAVITSIALDHQQYLGATREAIGQEKAGIIREGKPVIYGEKAIPPSVETIAREKKAPLYQWGSDFVIEEKGSQWLWHGAGKTRSLPRSGVLPQNVGCAVSALQCLPFLSISWDSMEAGIAAVRVPGRWQGLVYQGVPCYVDVAHNVAAVHKLATRLAPLGNKGCWRGVFSSMEDKDPAAMVGLLKPFIGEWYVAPLDSADSHQRQATLPQLQRAFREAAIDTVHYGEQVSEAFQTAIEHSKPQDRIVAWGSFHTVAAVLKTAGIKTISQLLSHGAMAEMESK